MKHLELVNVADRSPQETIVLAPKGEARETICFLVRAFDGGGAQRDAILLANGIAQAGVPVSIMVLHAAGALRALVIPKVQVIDLGGGRKLKMALALPRLAKALSEHKPMIFVASEASGNALAVVATRMVPRTIRPRLVLREVASPLQARRNDPYLQNRLAYRLAPLLYGRADLVLVLTEPARRDLIAHFGVPAHKAVRLGTNAVLTPAMLDAQSKLVRRPEPGLLVGVGRLSPEKDFSTLIDAVALVRRCREVQLVIAGEGPERALLEAKIAQLGLGTTVELAGFQSDPAVLLNRAQLFVSSSRHEGLGNAIIEALACGVPVIATDAPYGPREVLEDGKWGELVPVGDSAALAKAITAQLDEPRDGSVGKVRAADFTVEAAARAFLLAVEKIGPQVHSS